MANFHSPERQPNESLAQYRERLKMSRKIAKIAKTGQVPAKEASLLEQFKRGKL